MQFEDLIKKYAIQLKSLERHTREPVIQLVALIRLSEFLEVPLRFVEKNSIEETLHFLREEWSEEHL